MTKNALQLIRSYYDDVDASTSVTGGRFNVNEKAVAHIVDRFAEDGRYDRQGHPEKVGKEEVRLFFGQERSLCGKHVLASVEAQEGIPQDDLRAEADTLPNPAECQTVVVHGYFNGSAYVTKGEGPSRQITQEHPAALKFTDYWVLQAGKVAYRQSDIQVMQAQNAGRGPAPTRY